MASRDRTDLYRSIRAINAHTGAARRAPDDENPLIAAGVGSAAVGTAPTWVLHTDGINALIDQLNRKMATLKSLHTRHLERPGISANVDEENQIQAATADIAKLFSHIKTRVKEIDSLETSGATNEQETIKKNLTKSYALQLQGLSKKFQASQESYLTKLQRREKQGDVFGDDLGAGVSDAGYVDNGFTANQAALAETIVAEAAQQSAEILALQRSMVELAEMFKDLSLLVIEQGTMLDVIESNIQSVDANVTQGLNNVVQADKSHQAYTKKLIILGLIVVVLILLAILIARKNSGGSK